MVMSRTFLEWALDEKVVLSFLAVFFGTLMVLLIKWHADKEYIMAFSGFVGLVLGALMRGITHQISDNGNGKP
jgi:hypothetical protein